MDFFEAVDRRRSCRHYSATPVPKEVVEKAIDAALLAPNSSNMQTWKIHWVREPAKKAALVSACMGQGAARTAQELLVFTADYKRWKKNRRMLLESIKDNPRKDLHLYYGKLMPIIYGNHWAAPFKWLYTAIWGLWKPLPREVAWKRDIQEVTVKSAALA